MGPGDARWTRCVLSSRWRKDEPTLAAMVAQAWLDRDDARGAACVSTAHHPLVRGMRHKPAVTSREAWREDFRGTGLHARSAVGAMVTRYWRENGLHFELQAPWWHLPEAAELARDFPDVTIVVNHTALPSDRSEQGLAGWRENLALLAREPNVALEDFRHLHPRRGRGPSSRTAWW